jgi:beta-lactamase superfamily II metal-dependent hydrolase
MWFATASAFTPSGLLEIHYINVGWGTSVLVVGPTGITMLMDGGRDNEGTLDVMPYMQSIGLTAADGLDYVVSSHLHSDHLAGLTQVMNGGYDVSTAVYYNGSNYSNSYVTAFKNAASGTTSGAARILTPGTVIQLGGGATATCICANGTVWGYGAVSGAQSDENDRSIGLLIEYGDFEYFFAGDLGGGDTDNSCTGRSTDQVNVETPVAQTIKPGGAHPLLSALGLEVIHVNHHGSESSTNPDFINLLTPRIACIATGSGQSDSYMFPRHDVVDHVLMAGVSCMTGPAVTVLQNEEGYPAGTLTSYAGYCIGDMIIKTNGQRLFQVSGSGRLHEGPDERAALGLPRYYPLDEDTSDHVAPGAISTLTATGGPTSTQITLRWTASGDDGTTGQAALYDIRYRASSYGPIDTDAEWNAATKITTLPFPKTSGSAETLVVSGLTSGQSYYFVMKTTDDALNLSALSNSPLGTAGSATGNITGTVTDTRGFVSGAIVTANDGLGHVVVDTTGSNGVYLFTTATGTYAMTFAQPSHRDTTRTGIVVTNGGTTTVNMVMERLKGNIAGNVTASGIGALANVRVQINNGSQEDTTAANGYYILSNLTDSTYSVKFSHPDYRDTIVSGVVVTPNGTTTLNMIMRKAYGWVAGAITDTSGAPLQNVYVKIQTPALRINQNNSLLKKDTEKPGISMALAVDSVYTDSLGYYSSRVLWGTYNVSFSKLGYLDTTVINVTVTANDTTAVSPVMTPFNYLPVITSQAIDTATEHILFKYIATAADQDDPSLNITISNYPSWLQVAGDTIFGITPEGASDTTFRIIASDGVGADSLIVSLKVINVNDPPQITSADSAIAQQHLLLLYTATATDPEGVSPIITFRNYPHWLQPGDSTISGIAPANAVDTSFKVIASDGVIADTQQVRIRVIQVNDPPFITSPDSAIATEHVLFSYTATASDSDGTSPSISFSNYPGWMHTAGATITGTPPEGAVNTSFVIIASDGALADTQLVMVRVIPVNDPPVITSPDSAVATESQLFTYTARAADPEGVTPTITFREYPVWLSVTDSTIAGIPPSNAPSATFKIIASDGILADTQLVTIRIIQINDPPVITSADSTVAIEHQLFSYTATAIDPDGTIPAITFSNYASWLQVAGSTISGIPPENPSNTSFRIIASDGALADTMIVTVRVIPVNDPPVITSSNSASATPGSFFEYTAAAFDPEGAGVTITFSNYTSWLSSNSSSIFGTPPVGATDTTFRIIASDGTLSDTLIVSISMASGCVYLLGDINSDNNIVGGDVTYGVRYFKGIGPVPPDSCFMDSTGAYIYVAGDVNGNCEFRGSDISRLVSYFQGGATLANCHFFPTQPLKTKREKSHNKH